MELKSFPNASDIPEKYLPSLVKSEIECWGSRPFDEFMKCTDKSCWKMYAIEDVYWSVENYRNRKEDKEFNCDCWCQAELYYKPEEFIEVVREYIKWEVSAVLLLVNEEVEGFWVISKTTLLEAINIEFATRPLSYDKQEILKELSEKIFWIENASEKEIIILHQIFVSEFIRWWWIGKKLLENLIKTNSNKNLPFLLETRYDSKFYPISRFMWFENLVNDNHWYIIQYNKEKTFINSKNLNKFLNQISNNFELYKKEALEILKFNPIFSYKKKYI